jgi:hypothetical protein
MEQFSSLVEIQLAEFIFGGNPDRPFHCMNLWSLYAGGWNFGFSSQFRRNETLRCHSGLVELLPKLHEKETKGMFTL